MAGALLTLVVVFVLYLDSRSDLQVWHTLQLEDEFTSRKKITTLEEYLALEERLFRQLDERIYDEIPEKNRNSIARYSRGSLVDPGRWQHNWNRTFELTSESPQAAVLLLHGMSDSPYSVRLLAQQLHEAGAHVLALRMPGHGTLPSGLVKLKWQDMDQAVRLGVMHLHQLNSSRPLYIVGYSTGAALAVNYALSSLQDSTLPKVGKLVLLSPAIGVTEIAVLAKWQARLGHKLGLEKLAWSDILPEYDPFKYNSFAVNAGDVVYQLTEQIKQRIIELDNKGKLADFPSTLAFSSVVDATVSAPELIKGFFSYLQPNNHELVLFDVNRYARIEPIMSWDPSPFVQAFHRDPERGYTLSVLTNQNARSNNVILKSTPSGKTDSIEIPLNYAWPEQVYSLSHVALPFSAADPLYGKQTPANEVSIPLGNLALRGERNVLEISPSELLRLRWNPFYEFMKKRIFNFVGIQSR